MFGYRRGEPFRVQRVVRPKNVCVLLLFIYIVLESIVLATCTTPLISEYYLTSITYNSLVSNVPIQQLRLHMGYFSSCISVNEGDWSCGINAYQMLLALPEFNTEDKSCVDLYNLVVSSADLIRKRCLTPYVLLISVVTSFLILVLMASISPYRGVNFYYFVFAISYVSLLLSVIASVWQETNIKTVNLLLTQVLDNYYSLQTSYGDYCRAAIWVGTAIQIIISASCLLIATENSRFLLMWSFRPAVPVV